ALLACTQALFWSPMPVPYFRVVLAILALPAIAITGIAAQQLGVSHAAIAATYLAIIPFAYLGAVRRLSSGRRGDEAAAAVRERTPAAETPCSTLPSFKNADSAQFWFEWKRNGVAMPIVIACSGVFFTMVILLANSGSPIVVTSPEKANPF